jgi:hypothetical protein
MPTEQLAKARRKAYAWEKPSDPEPPRLTHEDLDIIAEDAVIALRESGSKEAMRSDFTCYGCGAATCCPFVYDLYCTSGDCLGDK